jgi:hypothetical protein
MMRQEIIYVVSKRREKCHIFGGVANVNVFNRRRSMWSGSSIVRNVPLLLSYRSNVEIAGKR